MNCDKCKHFKILYEPLRDIGELWDMGRAKCEKRNLIVDFANHGKFKRLDTCENYEPKESEGKTMTDREQVISVLTEHLKHCKSIHTKDEVINALTFAIESIKVDRAYDLAYEKVESEV